MLLVTYMLHVITLEETNVLWNGTKGSRLGSVIFSALYNNTHHDLFKSKDPPKTRGQHVHET